MIRFTYAIGPLLLFSLYCSAAVGQMKYPLSAAVSKAGIVFVADRNLPGVWQVEKGLLSALFEASPKYRTPLNAVRCVAIDGAGHLLAGDSSTREVYRFGDDAQPVPLTKGGIGIPMGIAVNQAGELLVSDLELHRIYKVPAEGGEAALFAEIAAPRGVFVDGKDRLWVVSGSTKDQLQRVSPDGKIEVLTADRVFQFPHDVVVDGQGTAFVSDGYAKAVWKIPAGGKPEKWISGEPLVNPVGLAWQGETLLVVDPRANAIFQVSPQGDVSKLEIKSDQ